MRKPLRSSPLAGPALSSEGANEDKRPRTRRPRVSSTPNLHYSRALSELPPPLPPAPPVPTPLPTPKRLSRRASLLEMVKRPLAQKPHPPLPTPPSSAPPANNFGSSIIHVPLPSPPLSPPPPSPRRHARARSRTFLTASMSMTDLGASRPAPPNFPRAFTAPSSSRRTSTVPALRANASVPVCGATPSGSDHHRRKDSEDNWLTATPYGTTPRFSRLGLAAPSIVLPVPARAARRKSMRGEGGKRVSLVHPAPVTPPRSSSLIGTNPMFSTSTPSLIWRSRSRSFSSEGPPTPSAASIFGADDRVVLAKDEDEECPLSEENEVDLALISPRDFDAVPKDALPDDDNAHAQVVIQTVHKPEHPFALAEPPSSWGLSTRHHRRSHNATKGMSFLSFGSGDSDSSAFSPMQSPIQSHFPAVPPMPAVRTPAAVADNSNSYLDVDSLVPAVKGNSTGTKKAAETVRRLLRSLSGRRAT